MIGVLLLSTTFLLMILIILIVIAVYIYRTNKAKEDMIEKRFQELTARIDETQRLFRNDVTAILKHFKSMLR